MAEEVKFSEIKVVKVSEAQTKDGRKFPIYKTIIKGNKTMDLCFTQTVKNRPEHPCIIRVPDGKWNIDRSGLYPRCWVKEILEEIPLPVKEQENPFI